MLSSTSVKNLEMGFFEAIMVIASFWILQNRRPLPATRNPSFSEIILKDIWAIMSLFLVLYSSGKATEGIHDRTELWDIVVAKR